MPRSAAARAIRIATSPRLAIRMLLKDMRDTIRWISISGLCHAHRPARRPRACPTGHASTSSCFGRLSMRVLFGSLSLSLSKGAERSESYPHPAIGRPACPAVAQHRLVQLVEQVLDAGIELELFGDRIGAEQVDGRVGGEWRKVRRVVEAVAHIVDA